MGPTIGSMSLGHTRNIDRSSCTQFDIVWPQRAFCLGTLGLKHLIHGQLDPCGRTLSNSDAYGLLTL